MVTRHIVSALVAAGLLIGGSQADAQPPNFQGSQHATSSSPVTLDLYHSGLPKKSPSNRVHGPTRKNPGKARPKARLSTENAPRIPRRSEFQEDVRRAKPDRSSRPLSLVSDEATIDDSPGSDEATIEESPGSLSQPAPSSYASGSNYSLLQSPGVFADASVQNDLPEWQIPPVPELPQNPGWTDWGGACSDGGFGALLHDRLWFRAEFLLLWSKGADMPALATTSPSGTAQGQAGVLGGARHDTSIWRSGGQFERSAGRPVHAWLVAMPVPGSGNRGDVSFPGYGGGGIPRLGSNESHPCAAFPQCPNWGSGRVTRGLSRARIGQA